MTALRKTQCSPLIGECSDFCPKSEFSRRLEQKQLHVLEVGDSAHVVKEYTRAGAGHVVPHPNELRPPDVLLQTICYLVINVVDRTDHPWHCIFEFVTNRIQAIRQDITFQALEGPQVYHIFQLACRFHIYSQYRLWNYPLRLFDPILNSNHIQQCLTKTDVETVAEFEAFYILVNLGNQEVLNRALRLPSDIKLHEVFRNAISISLSFSSNNFVKCSKLIPCLPHLHQATVIPHLYQMRRRALQIMCTAYGSKNGSLPIDSLCKWLLLDDRGDATKLCNAHGIAVENNFVLFRKGCFQCLDKIPSVKVEIPELLNHPPSQFIMSL